MGEDLTAHAMTVLKNALGADGELGRQTARNALMPAQRRVAELEAALVTLIDAIDAKDEKAIEDALLVGRGLTF